MKRRVPLPQRLLRVELRAVHVYARCTLHQSHERCTVRVDVRRDRLTKRLREFRVRRPILWVEAVLVVLVYRPLRRGHVYQHIRRDRAQHPGRRGGFRELQRGGHVRAVELCEDVVVAAHRQRGELKPHARAPHRKHRPILSRRHRLTHHALARGA